MVVEDVVDALADDLLGGRVELVFGGEVFGPLLEGAIFGGAMTVVVDDGVAQDAVEPGDGGLVAAEGGGLLHGADVGGLDDVLGGGAGGYAAFDELEELLSLVDEAGDGVDAMESFGKERCGGCPHRSDVSWMRGQLQSSPQGQGCGQVQADPQGQIVLFI